VGWFEGHRSRIQTLCFLRSVPEALGRRRTPEHEDGDIFKVMRLENSGRLVTPVHEGKRDGDGEEEGDDHDEDLLRFVFVVLLNLLALNVSVPVNIISTMSPTNK